MSGAGDQFPETTIRHAFDLWFNPEIIRRREAGLVPATFVLFAAQVVIDPEATAPVVRLNEEVQGAFKARPARQVAKGEVVRLLDIKELEGHSLGDDDPNAGHLTVGAQKHWDNSERW